MKNVVNLVKNNKGGSALIAGVGAVLGVIFAATIRQKVPGANKLPVK